MASNGQVLDVPRNVQVVVFVRKGEEELQGVVGLVARLVEADRVRQPVVAQCRASDLFEGAVGEQMIVGFIQERKVHVSHLKFKRERERNIARNERNREMCIFKSREKERWKRTTVDWNETFVRITWSDCARNQWVEREMDDGLVIFGCQSID